MRSGSTSGAGVQGLESGRHHYKRGASDLWLRRLNLTHGPQPDDLTTRTASGGGRNELCPWPFVARTRTTPAGRVLAIDRESAAVDATQARAAQQGLVNVEAAIAGEDTIPGVGTFDGAFGRYVLLHQRQPVEMIRRAAGAVYSGGVVGFHEIINYPPNRFQALPRVELFDSVAHATNSAFVATVASPEAGGHMVALFQEVGLPSPKLNWECVVGDAQSTICRWLTLSYLRMLPHIERLGLVPDTTGDPATLVERLEAQLRDARAQVVSNPQACAWAEVP
jgi:hypothetical protein